MIEKTLVDLGRDFVEKSFNKGTILLVGLTGSHFYGFPAPDSDLDLKGIHVIRPFVISWFALFAVNPY